MHSSGDLNYLWPFFRIYYGAEFSLAFALTVQQAGVRLRYIKPRCPEQNGKVERSHRVDEEEFWSRATFDGLTSAAQALRAWEHQYNHDRFSMALQGLTPAEKLATFLSPPAPSSPTTPCAHTGAAA
ncbi:transposase [Nitrospirales bacterium NOB]|nr:transposase [Nitrospirales bacterium NOB]